MGDDARARVDLLRPAQTARPEETDANVTVPPPRPIMPRCTLEKFSSPGLGGSHRIDVIPLTTGRRGLALLLSFSRTALISYSDTSPSSIHPSLLDLQPIMRFATPVALSLAAIVSQVMALVVNSPPTLIQCQPAAITWSEGPGGDVFLSVIEGGNPASAALVSFDTQNGASGSYTWTVDLDAGTSVTLKAVDSTGVTAYSSQVTIQAGNDDSCVNASGNPQVTSSFGSSSAASSSTSSSSVSTTSNSAASTVSSRASAISSSASSVASEASSALSQGISGASSVASRATSALGEATSAVGAAVNGVTGGNGAADRRVELTAAAGVLTLAMSLVAVLA